MEDGGTTENLQINTDYILNNSDETNYEIEFVNSKLIDYSKVDIIYSAVIKENASFVSGGYTNDAFLTYSSAVNQKFDNTQNNITNLVAKKSVSISTGGFKILKKAGSEKGEG